MNENVTVDRSDLPLGADMALDAIQIKFFYETAASYGEKETFTRDWFEGVVSTDASVKGWVDDLPFPGYTTKQRVGLLIEKGVESRFLEPVTEDTYKFDFALFFDMKAEYYKEGKRPVGR